MVDRCVVAPNLCNHEIGVVLHVHNGSQSVIIALYAQVFLPQFLVMVPLLPIAGLDVLVAFNHVKCTGFKAVTGFYILLVDLFANIVDSQEFSVKIYYRRTERLQGEIEPAPAACLLEQAVTEHGVVPVVARCAQRKIIKLVAPVVMEQLV